jgi:hypothetical protein
MLLRRRNQYPSSHVIYTSVTGHKKRFLKKKRLLDQLFLIDDSNQRIVGWNQNGRCFIVAIGFDILRVECLGQLLVFLKRSRG